MKELIAIKDLVSFTDDELLTYVKLETSLNLKKGNQDQSQASVQKIIGRINNLYINEGTLDQALEVARKGYEIFESMEYTYGIVWTLFWVGYIYLHKGDLDRAVKYSEKGLTKNELINDQNVKGFLLNTIGITHTYRGELEQALGYYKQSQEIFRETNNSYRVAAAYNNLGETYDDFGDFRSAIDCFERGLEIARDIPCPRTIAELLYQSIRRYCNILQSETISNYLKELLQCSQAQNMPLVNQ